MDLNTWVNINDFIGGRQRITWNSVRFIRFDDSPTCGIFCRVLIIISQLTYRNVINSRLMEMIRPASCEKLQSKWFAIFQKNIICQLNNIICWHAELWIVNHWSLSYEVCVWLIQMFIIREHWHMTFILRMFRSHKEGCRRGFWSTIWMGDSSNIRRSMNSREKWKQQTVTLPHLCSYFVGYKL